MVEEELEGLLGVELDESDDLIVDDGEEAVLTDQLEHVGMLQLQGKCQANNRYSKVELSGSTRRCSITTLTMAEMLYRSLDQLRMRWRKPSGSVLRNSNITIS